MGDFAQQIAIAYRIGTAAEAAHSQLSRLGVRCEDFFALFEAEYQQPDSGAIGKESRGQDPLRRALLAGGKPRLNPPSFQITRSNSDPKQRWVDGTPGIPFQFVPSAKLFPDALHPRRAKCRGGCFFDGPLRTRRWNQTRLLRTRGLPILDAFGPRVFGGRTGLRSRCGASLVSPRIDSRTAKGTGIRSGFCWRAIFRQLCGTACRAHQQFASQASLIRTF